MSIQNEIDRIKANVAAAYAKITSKGGTAPTSKVSANLASAIDTIPVGVDTSDATAAAGDILSGKTAYVKGAKVTGAIASKKAADLTVRGAAVTVPAGYYPSSVSKSVATATQATPSITVDSAGKITAQVAQPAGYVLGGIELATQQLTTQAAQTITPGTTAKTAVAAGRYTTGAVTVAGDANLKAGNIKKGVSIFGVEGDYEGETGLRPATVIIGTQQSIGGISLFAAGPATGSNEVNVRWNYYDFETNQYMQTDFENVHTNARQLRTALGSVIGVQSFDGDPIQLIGCELIGSIKYYGNYPCYMITSENAAIIYQNPGAAVLPP